MTIVDKRIEAAVRCEREAARLRLIGDHHGARALAVTAELYLEEALEADGPQNKFWP